LAHSSGRAGYRRLTAQTCKNNLGLNFKTGLDCLTGVQRKYSIRAPLIDQSRPPDLSAGIITIKSLIYLKNRFIFYIFLDDHHLLFRGFDPHQEVTQINDAENSTEPPSLSEPLGTVRYLPLFCLIPPMNMSSNVNFIYLHHTYTFASRRGNNLSIGASQFIARNPIIANGHFQRRKGYLRNLKIITWPRGNYL